MEEFELEIDDKSRVGSDYMARVKNELRRVASIEKAERGLTQQAIADIIGTSRAVINRELRGLENLTTRRTAELFWAMGWEAYFEARRIPAGENQFVRPKRPEVKALGEPVKIDQARPKTGFQITADAA